MGESIKERGKIGKGKRKSTYFRKCLVRETGLEFNVIQQVYHKLCNVAFVKHDIWCFCIVLYNAVKPFQKL